MKEQLTEFCTYLSDQKALKKTVNQEDIINNFITLHTDKKHGITEIVEVVAKETGISAAQMKVRNRKREVVEARQISMWIINGKTKLSLESIGAYFENNGHVFDHATVLHAIRTVNNLIETNKAFRNKIEKVKLAVEKVKNQ